MFRTCQIPNCTRHVKPGKPVCPHHRNTPEGKELIHQVRMLAQALTNPDLIDSPAPPGNHTHTTRKIRRRAERGDFHPLLTSAITELADLAATERQINTAIGANHVGIARIFNDMPDSYTFSLGIVRHSNAIADLIKLRHKHRKLTMRTED